MLELYFKPLTANGGLNVSKLLHQKARVAVQFIECKNFFYAVLYQLNEGLSGGIIHAKFSYYHYYYLEFVIIIWSGQSVIIIDREARSTEHH